MTAGQISWRRVGCKTRSQRSRWKVQVRGLSRLPGAFKKRDVWLYTEDPEETGLGGGDVWGLGVFSTDPPRLTA